MRVICIDASKMNKYGILKEGQPYEATEEKEVFGFSCYKLSEHNSVWYKKHMFIPVGEADENEFERNYDKEIKNQ